MDPQTDIDAWAQSAYRALDTDGKGFLYRHEILEPIYEQGVHNHHTLDNLIKVLSQKKEQEPIQFKEFARLTHGLIFLKRVYIWDLTIPHFDSFRKKLERSFKEIKSDVNNEYSWGEIATYIPPLAKADPNWFSTSFCSTDGQLCKFGDHEKYFSIQSIGKVVAYAFLHNMIGDEVHKWVGEEPSGVAFNAPIFDKLGRPHNPMVNAGAIMVCSLIIYQNKSLEDIIDFFQRACDTPRAKIDNQLYQEEKLTGYNNHALASLMLANKAFPQQTNAEETKRFSDSALDLYFMNCSLMVNVESLARFGAMLANNGINPTTGERILNPKTVQAVVTLMTTCGMYNGAGKFTKDLGVPSKSGVSGGLLTVIPGIGAFCTWSPPLNEEGNPVRGIAMIYKLNSIYSNFNLFHKDMQKLDVTRKPFQTKIHNTQASIQTAAEGDIEGLIRLHNSNVSLDEGDYDQRTPLHLASASGQIEAVKYLISLKVRINPTDRWGATPLNDAKTRKMQDLLIKAGAKKGVEQLPYQELQLANVSDDQYSLIYAAANNDILLMKALHLKGWKVNSYDYDGRTALSLAASEGHLIAVKYLVVHGADPRHKDARGNDALADAIRENRNEVVTYLKTVMERPRL